MPRGFNDNEKESIRRSLLDAGREKLTTVGMHKTSVEDLTRAAHISKGAFYQFFPSKEALFITLLAEGERNYRDRLRAFARRPGETPRARLLAFMRDGLSCYRDTPLLSKVSRDDMHALLRAVTPAGMRAASADEVAFSEELYGILRESGISLACTPGQFTTLIQTIFFMDLYVHELGAAHAEALDYMLQALADKLTA